MAGKGKLKVVEAAPKEEQKPTAQTLTDEVNDLLNTLAGYGIDLRDTIDPRQIRPRLESFSACRMLIVKGICTEAEMHLMQLEAHRELLRGILQAAENQRLAQARANLVVPEGAKQSKGLVLAKH